MNVMLDRWHGPIAVARRLSAKVLAGEQVDSPTIGEPLCITDLASEVEALEAQLEGARAANAQLRLNLERAEKQIATLCAKRPAP